MMFTIDDMSKAYFNVDCPHTEVDFQLFIRALMKKKIEAVGCLQCAIYMDNPSYRYCPGYSKKLR